MWIRYDSRSGTHNMYKEYRYVSRSCLDRPTHHLHLSPRHDLTLFVPVCDLRSDTTLNGAVEKMCTYFVPHCDSPFRSPSIPRSAPSGEPKRRRLVAGSMGSRKLVDCNRHRPTTDSVQFSSIIQPQRICPTPDPSDVSASTESSELIPRMLLLCCYALCLDSDLASRHRARKSSVQIVRTAVVPVKNCKRPNILQFHVRYTPLTTRHLLLPPIDWPRTTDGQRDGSCYADF